MEALEAGRALPSLTDDAVSEALETASALVRERAQAVLAANAADVEAAAATLDEGTLDRLRLDPARVEALADQVGGMALIPGLEREIDAWTLPNGLGVNEVRIPIGTVGANFEARPNVALDVAAQLLKSLNTAVLRTGGAALRTVTVLVDDVLRPALERAGLPPGAVGLVRSPEREGARALVTLPDEIPLVILRGSGETTTATLARLAAEHGVRTLAHAEGGGVLYAHGSADRRKLIAVAEASLDRLGVCNRLNLCLVDRAATDRLQDLLALFGRVGVEARGTDRARTLASHGSARPAPGTRVGERPGTGRHGHGGRRRRAGRGGADRERRDLGPRCDDRRRGRAGSARVPDRLPGHGRVLAGADAVHRRLRPDGRSRDRHQRRLDARAARPGDLPRPVAAPVSRRRGRHARGDEATARREARHDA